MGSVLSNYKMTTYVGSIHLLNPFLRLMVLTMSFVLIILSNIPLSNTKMMEGHYNKTLDAAALIEINQKPLLITKWDNSLCPKQLDKCPASTESRQKICFKKCHIGSKYECVTSIRYKFGLEFCLNKRTTVDKGYQVRAIYLPQYNRVYLREEPCPAGTYKPEKAPMFVSCAEHNPPPPHFIIHTPGTTTTPPRGYCDWKNGYFNLDHYSFWYTNETYLTTCVHRSEHTYMCTENLDILPDGTCSQPCVGGERNPDNQFICTSGSRRALPTEQYKTTEKPSTTVPVVTKSASQNNHEKDKLGNNNPSIPVGLAILLSVVGVLGLTAVIVAILFVLVKRYCNYQGRNEHPNPIYVPVFTQNSNMSQNGSDNNNANSIRTDPDTTTHNTTHIYKTNFQFGGNAVTIDGDNGTATIRSRDTNGIYEPINGIAHPLPNDSLSEPLMNELKIDEEASIGSTCKIDSGLGTTTNHSEDETAVLKRC